jgi:hypothetical protein
MVELSPETVIEGLRAASRLRGGDRPSDQELADAPVLTLWTCVPLSAGFHRLAGLVVGHPRLRDGSCFTSAVLAIDPDLKWARTVSRLYVLGPPLSDRLDGGGDRP